MAAHAITINFTQASDTKGLRIKEQLVELYDLKSEEVRDLTIELLKAALFDRVKSAEMIANNIEVIT